MTAIAALMILQRPALAGPSGGTVVQGSAGISQSGSTTNISQSSNKAVINWQGFSIGAGETVNFNQPGSSSATLNRVIGNETSVISGALNANGQVFIVNSAGVLFGKGAQVNVGGLVASTLDISNANFMSGNYSFSGSSSASVVNQGRIRAHDGGYVALLGKTVSNDGVISATLGTVAMASGDKITLNFGGNSLIDVTIDQGTLNALVENKRAIIANGGQVIMTAKAADQVLSAQVNNSGIIQARTMAALKGGPAHVGKITLVADGGTTNVSGKLDASAPKRGNGGTIETSGNKVNISPDAVITTQAANGTTGTWTIDPDGFTIGVGGDITGAQLTSELASNNITILSTNGSGAGGNINVNDAVSWSANTLTLHATDNIFINNVMTATGTAGFIGTYGTGINADSTPMGLYVNLGAVNGAFGGRFDFSGSGGFSLNGTSYTVINTVSGLMAAVANPGGHYVLGSNLTAGLNSTNWSTPLDNGTAFTGAFNGLGHVISSFATAGTSLFGTIGTGAMVSNVGIDNANVAAGSGTNTSAGILADINQGSIVNSFVSSGTSGGTLNVSASVLSAGTLVGTNSGLIAQSYSANLSLNGVTQVGGGLVGTNLSNGYITESSVREDTSGFHGDFIDGQAASITYTGGFVGVNNGRIDKSYTLIGLNLSGAAVGGSSHAVSGGFVGLNTGTIDQSYSTLDPNFVISLSGNIVAGFAGTNTGTITNTYTDSLTDFDNVKWIAGFAYQNSGTISDSYSTAFAGGTPPQYGFVFDNTGGTVTNSYWNTPAAGTGITTLDNSTATNLSDAQSAILSSYVGFDPSIWGSSQSGYPILRNLPVYVSTIGSPAVYGNVNAAIATLATQGLQGSSPGLAVADLPLGVFFGGSAGGYINAGTNAAAADLKSLVYTNIMGTVTVTPAPLTVSGVVEDKTYDGTTSATLAPAGSGLIFGLVGDQLLNVIYTSAAFADKNAGTDKTVDINAILANGANGGLASNYTIANTTTADITPKSITAAATGNDRVYDGTTADTLFVQLPGMVAGDNLSLGYTAAFADKNAGSGKAVSVSGLTLTGTDSGNYVLQNSSLQTVASITPLPLDLTGAKPADGSASASAADLAATNVVAGDSVQLGGSVTLASAAAGTEPIVNVSALTVNNPNYTVVGSAGSVVVGGGNLVASSVSAGTTIGAPSGNTTTITQTTPQAIIDWLSFSLAANEILNFIQPSSTSVILNKVIGNEPSVIAGTLNANGRVFIVNSAGILFAAGSTVDVGALVASTVDISETAFDAGNYLFSGAGSGLVVAKGNILIADGGFAALLSGNGVTQSGAITAPGGKVVLASASTLSLSLNTVDNGLASYTVGPLTGTVSAAGSIDVSSSGGNGGLLETAGTSIDAGQLTLNTGTSGTWSWTQNADIIVGVGGAFTGQFASNSLAARNFTLTSRSGDITFNSEVDWSANTTLTLNAANDINFNASINASGASAGLAMTYGAGHDYNILTPASFSGVTSGGVADAAPAGTTYASITLSGASAGLTINGSVYTLVQSMSDLSTDLADVTKTRFALGQDLTAPSAAYTSVVAANLNGTLAGFGHTISGLNITNTANTNTGLIGSAAAGSVIRDIGLLGVNVANNSGAGGGSVGVGALVGQNSANVSHAYSTGSVSGGGNLGGLIGLSMGNTISNSYSEAAVSGSGGGGLVGRALNVDIESSHATGDITSGGTSGGLIGFASGTNVSDSYATGSVTGGASSSLLGGLIGNVGTGTTALTIDNSYATGAVTGGYELGGLIGALSSTLADFTIENSRAGPVPPMAAVTLTSNLDLSVTTPHGIGGLVGYVISSSTSTVLIKNSQSYENVEYTPGTIGSTAGGLVGLIDGGKVVIDGSSATGNVTGNATGSGTGGLVGQTSTATLINNSTASGVVTGNLSVGGLVGGNAGTISNSSASGAVTGSGDNIGGLAGSNVGTIENSSASGDVTGTGPNSSTGGLVGTNGGLIINSFAGGTVKGPAGITGGIAGVSFNNSGDPTNTTAGAIINSFYNGDKNSGLPITNFPSCCNPGLITGGGPLTTQQFADVVSFTNGTITQVVAQREAVAEAAQAAADQAASQQAAAAALAAQQAAAVQAAAQQAAAQQAAVQQAAAQQAATAQQAAGTANVSASNAEASATSSPDSSIASAGTDAVAGTASKKIDDNVKTIEETIKVEERRERRKLAAVAAAKQGSGHRAGGFGASIRTIDVDGQRFDLQNNGLKKDTPGQSPQ
jgi:filamentous hemagglutinin family protein